MRRTDREITDRSELLSILRRCETIRVAMVSDGAPYIVPLSFGFEEQGDSIVLYFHSALSGRKVEALAQAPFVCIEADIFYKTEPTARGITARYESLIGFGSTEKLEGDEKLHALRCLLAHYGYATDTLPSCTYLPHTAVYKVTLSSLTGKRNLPADR